MNSLTKKGKKAAKKKTGRTAKDRAKAGFFVLVFFLLGRLLFDVWIMAFFFAPMGLLIYSRIEKTLHLRFVRHYLSQFLDFLNVFSMASGVGKGGLEAFSYCFSELAIIYDKGRYFMKDLEAVLGKVSMDSDIYHIFCDHEFLVDREEIDVFAQMLFLSSKKGGDTERIVAYCSQLIEERVRMEREKEVLLAKQKFELDVIMVLPVVLLLTMKSLSPDYMQRLLDSPVGLVALALSVVLIGAGIFMGVVLCQSDLAS